MIKFLIALTLMFAAPTLAYAKSPKCKKGDKACEKKQAKKDKKADKKKNAKKDKKADKKTAKKDKKSDKKVAKHKPEKKKKKVKNMDIPAETAADVSDPMPLPDSMTTDSAAPSPSPATTAAVTPPAASAPQATKNDLEDDIFPESSSTGGAAPAAGTPSGDDFLDEELPAE